MTYLGRADFLRFYREYVSAADLQSMHAALQRAASQNPARSNVRPVLVKWLANQPERFRDAVALAEEETRSRPASAEGWIALGSLHLRAKEPQRAIACFEKAVNLRPLRRPLAAALLGLASAYLAQGNSAQADNALETVRRTRVNSSDLNDGAYEQGIDLVDALEWRLARLFITEGNIDRAAEVVTFDNLDWLAQSESVKKNNDGVRLYNQNDFKAARTLLLEAIDLAPASSKIWENLATVAFELDRYAESLRAFRRVTARKLLDERDSGRIALAAAVDGDYPAAAALAALGLQRYPNSNAIREWQVVYAFALGGWNGAEAVWRQNRNPDTYALFDLIERGVRDFARRSDRAGIRYATLAHKSLLYRILGEGSKQSGTIERWSREERERVLTEIVNAYRQVGLKPVVPVESLRLAAQAAAHVDRGEWLAAERAYRQALECAPWWPEGHFNLGLTARVNNSCVSPD